MLLICCMEKNMMNPLKVYQKGNEKTNSLIKSDGKLNYWELTFLSGSAWKHITEMPAEVFLELTIKVSINYFWKQYGMFLVGNQISFKTLSRAGNRNRPIMLHQAQKGDSLVECPSFAKQFAAFLIFICKRMSG